MEQQQKFTSITKLKTKEVNGRVQKILQRASNCPNVWMMTESVNANVKKEVDYFRMEAKNDGGEIVKHRFEPSKWHSFEIFMN